LEIEDCQVNISPLFVPLLDKHYFMSEEKKIHRTEIESYGEFGFIDHLTRDIKLKNKSTIKGVGDDVAVLEKDDEHYLLVTNDLLVEDIHFDFTYTPLKHLGYKAAIVNFSDIYAMNGTPEQLIIGISVSNRFSAEAIEEIYSGIYLACEYYGVDVIGGDTTSSTQNLFISISVIGKVKKNEVVYRSGAKKGDLVCVSGDLGSAYAGLLVLEREKAEFAGNPDVQPDLDKYNYVLERQLKPEARKDIIELLKKINVKPTAMIDVSDGLASDIMHICKNSGTCVNIYEDKLPIDPQTISVVEELKILPAVAALNGGEDYELLFTVDINDYEKVKNLQQIHIIGHMTEKEEGNYLISNDGNQITLNAQGWDAFKDHRNE
jgi:thiamine-monophosphate kinase